MNIVSPKSAAEKFYADSLKILNKSGLPFMIAGTYAYTLYTGIKRETKDLDIFCTSGDYPKILKVFEEHGYTIELTDARWLAKIKKKEHFIDIIFGTSSGITPIDVTWLEHAQPSELFVIPVKIIPVEEFIWSKSFVQGKASYGGADINHMILKKGQTLDWKRLLLRMDHYWEVLLGHLLNYRFVYPSERETVPKWLMEELIGRLKDQLSLPTPKDKVCRGALLSHSQYEIDIKEWGFKSIT